MKILAVKQSNAILDQQAIGTQYIPNHKFDYLLEKFTGETPMNYWLPFKKAVKAAFFRDKANKRRIERRAYIDQQSK